MSKTGLKSIITQATFFAGWFTSKADLDAFVVDNEIKIKSIALVRNAGVLELYVWDRVSNIWVLINGVSTFLRLPDSPSSYVNQKNKTLKVNNAEDAVIFVPDGFEIRTIVDGGAMIPALNSGYIGSHINFTNTTTAVTLDSFSTSGGQSSLIVVNSTGQNLTIRNNGTGDIKFNIDADIILPPNKFLYFEIIADQIFRGWVDSVPGPQGQSNYEIAVENGFIGTEAEWLESIKGEAGGDYRGIATPSFNPGTPIEREYYFASETGIYTNFSNISVDITNGLNILSYDGTSWVKMIVPLDMSGYVENEAFEIEELKTTLLGDDDFYAATGAKRKFWDVDLFTSSDARSDIFYDTTIKDVSTRILVNDPALVYTIFTTPYDYTGKDLEIEFFATADLSLASVGIGVGLTSVNDGTVNYITYQPSGTVQEFNSSGVFVRNISGTGASGTYTTGDRISIKIKIVDGITFTQTSKNGVYSAIYSNSSITRRWGIFTFLVRTRAQFSKFTLVTNMVESEIDYNTILLDDINGLDTNDGVTTPVKTLAKALSLLKSGFNLKINQGDYREILDFRKVPTGCKIYADEGERVRILGSDRLTGWTKTSGYNNIYEVTTEKPNWASGSATTARGRLWQDDVNSYPITSAERNPLQKSRSHRLRYTPILYLVNSATLFATDTEPLATRLTELDATPARFYYSGGKLYIHTAGSTNPVNNRIEIPRRKFTEPSIVTGKHLTLENIGFSYGDTGVNTGIRNTIKRINVRVNGVLRGDGFNDNSCFVESYFDEAADASNDGINGHFYFITSWDTKDISQNQTSMYYSPWLHDNWDDGWSHHERSKTQIIGGLAEYNKDNGFILSNTGNCEIHNAIARFNGIPNVGLGSGFSQAGAATNADTTLAGILNCYNCVSIGNRLNFYSQNLVNLHSCIARDSIGGEFYVGTNSIINAYDCKGYNATPSLIQVKQGGAILNVINTPNLIVP